MNVSSPTLELEGDEFNFSGGFIGVNIGNVIAGAYTSYFSSSAANSIGHNFLNGIWSKDFYYLETSVPESYEPTSGETALTDAQMRQQASFAGFDFGETGPWVMPSEGYPILKAFARTVAFDANGGEGAPEAQVNLRYEPLTLSTTVPTKEGYNFVGWASESGATYAPGDAYTADEDITLTAVWEAVETPTPEPCWKCLPGWVQWLLRWICFGWLWMK